MVSPMTCTSMLAKPSSARRRWSKVSCSASSSETSFSCARFGGEASISLEEE